VQFGTVLEVNGGATWGCFGGERRCILGLFWRRVRSV